MIVLVAELLWATLWPLVVFFVILSTLLCAAFLATCAINAWDARMTFENQDRHELLDEIEEYLRGR